MDTLFAAAARAGAAPSIRDADEALLERLRSLMDGEKAYRDPALCVAAVAERLALPEYVLRRLINERLGHHNFAAFVNEYRLQEVTRALANPGANRRPVLTLALESGFGSIAPSTGHSGSATASRRRSSARPAVRRPAGTEPLLSAPCESTLALSF